MKTGSLFFLRIYGAILCCLLPIYAVSWGLGNISVDSSLNEPLNAYIPLTDIKPDELSSLRLELLTQLRPQVSQKQGVKLQPAILPQLSQLNIAAQVRLRDDGQAFIHLTSQNPVYAGCDKISYNCYGFYQIGINADWRSRALVNHVTRNFSIIPKLDLALGELKLNSALGERLDLEISLLEARAELDHFKVNLAPVEAWINGIHSGENEFNYAQSLVISFAIEKNKLRLQSQGPFKRSFSNSYQDSSQPMVILLEATWKDGRELKKYIIYLPT